MSGGRHALKGFEYQAIVNLHILLENFYKRPEPVFIYPEGIDDLVVEPASGGATDYYQVKKPKETNAGVLKNEPWSLVDIAQSLLPGTYTRLKNNNDKQIWVLGDDVKAEVLSLINAGKDAVHLEIDNYLVALHVLSYGKAKIIIDDKDARETLNRWKPKNIADVKDLTEKFSQYAVSLGATKIQVDAYVQFVSEINLYLPDALERTIINSVYGSEEDILTKVQITLKDKYNLELAVIKHTLIPCLRSFINILSTQTNKKITSSSFEQQVRAIWPKMNLVSEPLPLTDKTLRRDTLVKVLLSNAERGASEVIGVSGSGKTTLASEVFEYQNKNNTKITPFYSVVEPENNFRDVLAGISFKLLEMGYTDLFNQAVSYETSNQDALTKLAKALSLLPEKNLLLVDLVRGQCSDSFAQELVWFIEAMEGGSCQLIVFAQESSFRMLSAVNKKILKLPNALNIPGFNFEEFVSLVALYHEQPPERGDLYTIHSQLTVNRLSGLYARLAYLLASSDTLNDMQDLSVLPADEAFEEADRLRYKRVSDNLKNTADKLLCFLLPFSLAEAEGLFSRDRVKETVHELLRYGILRPIDSVHFEFHETTRKGLESNIAPEVLMATHAVLSEHYFNEEQITAGIYHLEKSGDKIEACRKAKAYFVAGDYCSELSSFIKRNNLLNESELLDLIKSRSDRVSYWVVAGLLADIKEENTAAKLIQIIQAEKAWFEEDFNWARHITEAVLFCDKAKLFDLIKLFLQKPFKETGYDSLGILTTIHRIELKIDQRILHLFKCQNEEGKLRLLPILFLDVRRDVLKEAFEFIESFDAQEMKSNGQMRDVLTESRFKLKTTEEVEEFLSAMKAEDMSEILISSTLKLGKFEKYVWGNRKWISGECLKIIENGCSESNTIFNALRILAYCQDSRSLGVLKILDASEPVIETIAKFLPCFFYNPAEMEEKYSHVKNSKLPLPDRLTAYTLYAMMGGNIDELIESLSSSDREKLLTLFKLTAVQFPSKYFIPLIEKEILEHKKDTQNILLPPVIVKTGELVGNEISEFLIRLLSCSDSTVIEIACLKLMEHRSKSALKPLLKIAKHSKDVHLSQNTLIAAMTSRPQSIEVFDGLWQPEAQIWRCNLIGRLGDEAGADILINTLKDNSQHWSVRRAAALAAGRLPFELVLEKVALPTLNETSTFIVDKHTNLGLHESASYFLLNFGSWFKDDFPKGKEKFVAFWGDFLQKNSDAGMGFSLDKSSGEDAADWIYERLAYYKFPENTNALDLILNEMHAPIIQAAVLRSLFLQGRLDVTDTILTATNSEWLLIRILSTWCKAGAHKKDDVSRLRHLVSESKFPNSVSARNILKDLSGGRYVAKPAVKNKAVEKKVFTTLTYHEITEAIENEKLEKQSPYIVSDLSEQELKILISELDPKNDYDPNPVHKTPSITFSELGTRIKNRQESSNDNRRIIRGKLRPIVAAANNTNISIEWHEKYLDDSVKYMSQRDGYYLAYIDALSELGHSDLFYRDLENNPDILISQLNKTQHKPALENLANEKLIPYLERYLYAGPDDVLETLTSLSLIFQGEKIDHVLQRLFNRWVSRFDLRKSRIPQHDQNVHLWRSFRNLVKHSRFKMIPGFDRKLISVLSCEMARYHQSDIAKVLSESPSAYFCMELLLKKTSEFGHWAYDNTDCFDDLAQELFHK